MRTSKNLGILAHVDAAKTTLTGRLLLAAGPPPIRSRKDDNPPYREAYLLRVARRVRPERRNP